MSIPRFPGQTRQPVLDDDIEAMRRRIAALGQQANDPKFDLDLTVPRTFTPEQARDMGVDLDPGWLLKLTPAADRIRASYLTPTKWEVLDDGMLLSPEGRQYKQGELPLASLLGPQTSEDEAEYEARLTEQFQQDEVRRILADLFPDMAGTEELFNYADLQPEEFLGDIRAAGRNVDTQLLVRNLFPGITEEEMLSLFRVGPEIPQDIAATIEAESQLDVEEAAKLAYGEVGWGDWFHVGTIPVFPAKLVAAWNVANAYLEKYVGRPWDIAVLEAVARDAPQDDPYAQAVLKTIEDAFVKYGPAAMFSQDIHNARNIGYAAAKAAGGKEWQLSAWEFANPVYFVSGGGLAGLAANLTSKVPLIGRALRGIAVGVTAVERGLAYPIAKPLELGLRGAFRGMEAIGRRVGEGPGAALLNRMPDIVPTLMELPNFDRVIREAMEGNWQRTVVQKLGKFGPAKWTIEHTLGKSVMVSARDTLDDVVGRGYIGRNAFLRMGRNARMAKTMELAALIENAARYLGMDKGTQYSGKMLSRVLPEYRGQGNTGTIEDIITHPERYNWEGMERGLEFTARVNEVNKEVLAMLERQGIAPDQLIEDWIHRVVIARKKGQELIQAQAGGPARGTSIGRTMSYEKPRDFPTMADGIAEGMRYDINPEVMVGEFIEEAFRKVADARFIRYVEQELRQLGAWGQTAVDRLSRYPEVFERIGGEEGRLLARTMVGRPMTEVTKQALEKTSRFTVAIAEALREGKVAPQTVQRIMRDFPALGAEFKRLVELPTSTEGHLMDFMQATFKWSDDVRRQIEGQKVEIDRLRAGIAADVPADDVIREAFKVMDFPDRRAFGNALQAQVDDLEQMLVEQRAGLRALSGQAAEDMQVLLEAGEQRLSQVRRMLAFLDEAELNPGSRGTFTAVRNPELKDMEDELYGKTLELAERRGLLKADKAYNRTFFSYYKKPVYEGGKIVSYREARRTVTLMDMVRKEGEIPETLTVYQARLIKGYHISNKPWPKAAMNEQGRVPREYVFDELAENLGFKSHDELFDHLKWLLKEERALDDMDGAVQRLQGDVARATEAANPTPKFSQPGRPESGIRADFWGYQKPVFSGGIPAKGTVEDEFRNIDRAAQRKAGLEAMQKEVEALHDGRKADFLAARAARKKAMELARQPDLGEAYLAGQKWATGRIFDREFVDAFNRWFGYDKGITALRWTAEVAGILRITKAALDMSAMAIQGVLAFGVAHTNLFADPKRGVQMMGAWYKAFGYQVGAFFKPDIFFDYMRANRDVVMRRVSFGGSSRGVFFFEELERELGSGGLLAMTQRAMNAIPFHPYRRAELSFMAAGEMVRNEFWKILSVRAAERGEAFQLARFLDRMTGVLDSNSLGLGVTTRQLETAFAWFAPSYTRASLSILADIFRGGMSGAEARKAVGGMMAAGATYYVGAQYAVSLSQGKSPEAAWEDVERGFGIVKDPITGDVQWKPSASFMTLAAGNYNMGIGGFWYGLVRLAGNISAAINRSGEREPIDLVRILKDGSLNYRDNPFIYWWYSRASPFTGAVMDIVKQRDFLGYPIEGWQGWAAWTAGLLTPIWIEQGLMPSLGLTAKDYEVPEGVAKAAVTAGEVFGLRSFPDGSWTKFYDLAKERIKQIPANELDEKQIQAWRDGKLGWAQLTDLQRTNLLSRYPELRDRYEQAVADSTIRDSSKWQVWTKRKDAERNVYYSRLTDLYERRRSGELDARKYRELVAEAGKNYGAALNAMERDPAYGDIYAFFEEKEAKGEKYGFRDDLAVGEFMGRIKYAEDLTDANGDMDWRERDRRLDDFVAKWGQDTYDRVLQYMNQKKALVGIDSYSLRRGEDSEALNAYWRIPPEKTSDGRDLRGEYRLGHPEDDARLAFWGYGGRVMSQRAYELVVQWSKEFGVPLDVKLPPPSLAPQYFEYNKLSAAGAASAEARLYRLDNPDFDKWGQDNLGWKPLDIKSPEALRISARWREKEKEYDAIKDKNQREAFLQANADYARARREREAYERGLLREEVEPWLAYHDLPDAGYEREWFLLENPTFYRAMVAKGVWQEKDLSKVPGRAVGKLYEEYENLRTKDGKADSKARLAFRKAHKDLDDWLVKVKGLKAAQ